MARLSSPGNHAVIDRSGRASVVRTQIRKLNPRAKNHSEVDYKRSLNRYRGNSRNSKTKVKSTFINDFQNSKNLDCSELNCN